MGTANGGQPPIFHGIGKLPRDDFLDRLRPRLFEYAFLLEKIVDARTHMFLAHY